MLTRPIFLTAGCIIAGALAMPLQAQDTTGGMRDSTNPPTTQPDMAGRATDEKVLAPDAKDIRGMLSDVTEAAVKKDGFDNLVRRFVDADRDRISKNNLTKADWEKLNGRIDEFRKDWKAKYNQDFDIDHPEMVFNDTFRIIQGQIGEAQPAGARMGDTEKSTPDTTPGAQSDKTAGGDVNREPGRKVAKVTFPASHNMPTLYIPLIREFPDAWKIDVPDTLDGRKLYDNLLTQLTACDEHKDMWPTDVNDAYRAVSHHVIMAVMDSQDKMPDMKRDDTMPRTGTGTDTGRTGR